MMSVSPYKTAYNKALSQESGRLTLLFSVFLLLVASFYLQLGYRWPVLSSFRHELLIAMILGPVAVVKLSKEVGWQDSRIVNWSGALILWMIVMVVLSDFPGESWDVFLDRVLKMAGFGLIIAGFVTHPRLLVLFIVVYLLVFLKITQEGITGLITGSMVWENQGVPRLHGSTPNYAHPNSLAGTQLAVLPFILFLIPVCRGLLKKVLIAQAVFTIIVIVICASRTAYLSGFICLLILVLRSGSIKQKFALLMFIPIITVAFMPEIYWARFESIFTGQELEGDSMSTRVQILRDSLGTFFDNPGGVGVGAFPFYRVITYGRVQDTHNLYLEVATNLGVIGIIIFSGFIAAVYKSLRRSSGKIADLLLTKGAEEDSLGYKQLQALDAICNGAIWYLIIRLLLGLFGHDLYEIYWWFLAGLAVSISICTKKAASRNGRVANGRLL